LEYKIPEKTVSSSIEKNVEVKKTEIKETLEQQREDGIIELNGKDVEI
jgi:hypothetical protein